ncbi:uncharacterized protein [Parasteatoda tepidariorum]|uniref:uncharacterized protein n=1 Tax=Parasteatoda tepidariorum TaxID=114398 RepID=UPI0039BC5FC1
MYFYDDKIYYFAETERQYSTNSSETTDWKESNSSTETLISSPATSTVTSTITSTIKTKPSTIPIPETSSPITSTVPTPEISSPIISTVPTPGTSTPITSAIAQISTRKETSPVPKSSPYVSPSSSRDIFIITSDVPNLTAHTTITYKPTNVIDDSNYFSSSFKPFDISVHGSSVATDFESSTSSMFISSESAPSSQATSKTSFSLTTLKYKLCKKNLCKNFGVCLEEEGKERCICNYPFGGPDCGGSYWCSKGFGKTECPAEKCRFDFRTKIGYCDCSKDQYYNYEKKQCENIDNCPFMDIKCTKPFEECKMGACVCIENFKRDDKQDCILMDLSPPKKRQKKSYISKAEKEIILNIYKTEEHSKPDVPIIDVADHAASAAGVSTASVFRIIKEYKRDSILHSPKRTKSRKSFLDDIDDFDKNAVRRKVHDFFRRNNKQSSQSCEQ